jgi:ABC-type nitrate/sulfonate/bicarbonate transport system substrate-binding protein
LLHIHFALPRRTLLTTATAALLTVPARRAWSAAALNVSYVRHPFNLPQIIMRHHGMLDRRLQPLGMEVVWHDITSGVLQAQALAAGSLDIGGVMNPISVILALANGNPIKIIGGFARNFRLAAILAKDPAITRIADLKGRTVAGLKGAVPQQLLIAALQSAGLGIADVTFLDMDLPATYTSILSGRVDAAVLVADLILKAQRAGAREIPTPPGLLQPVTVICARTALVGQRPDLVRLYQAAHREAVALVAADPEAAIRIGCTANGIDLADGRTLFSWQAFVTTLTAADLISLERDMTFVIENRLSPRPVDLRAAMFEAITP